MLSLSRTKLIVSHYARHTTTPYHRYMSVVNLSDNEAVQKFLIMNSKVILYYTATWCGPCRQIKPIYEEMSKKYVDDNIIFGKIDIDDNPDAAQDAQITSVPTFIGYIDEKSMVRFSGASTSQLEAMAEQLKIHK